MSRKKLQIKVNRIFSLTAAAENTVVINVGGARSGKSYAMAQLLIMRAVNMPGINIAITRKTMPALKMTALRLVLDLIKKYGFYKSAAYNKTENYYILNKSRIQFFSLDDPEKIKSSEFNYIWLEEANEFNYQDYLILLTRLSAPSTQGKQNQMYLTLNPSDANCWIAKKLLPQKGISIINSTYKDNPFLSKEYIDTLLSLKNYDSNAYNIFALGQWGSNDKMIYQNWQAIEDEPTDYDEVIWGLDFGFNNPTALVKIYIKDKIFTTKEYLYKTGLTNSMLIEELYKIIPQEQRNQTIYADSAEPDRIAEINRAGFNIKPALKAVLCGIMAVKATGINITKDSPNFIKEIQSYCWKCDLNGNTLEEPVKFSDHALDAMRYAIYTYATENSARNMPEVSFF